MRQAAARKRGGSGFLDPATLARIDSLELLARTVVDGFISGLHRSPYLGLSLDFAEHRPYNPGDDIRRIDWRLWARTDRYYVKEFEAETNTDFMVLLDVSASMVYGSGDITKLDYARYLAACLSYFSRQQRDRVGLVTFADAVLEYVPPAARHLDIVLHALDRIRPPQPADPADAGGSERSAGAAEGSEGSGGRRVGLAAALDEVADHVRRRGIAVLVSDFYEEPGRAVEAVRQLRHRGSDVMAFHVLDPAELEFPFDDASSFQDLETGERVPVVPELMRERYRERVHDHISTLSNAFADERVEYALFDTATPLDYALFRYLSDRERLRRVR